jgi:hypothetical protein
MRMSIGLGIIFLTTFSLIFIFFVMVEFSLLCVEGDENSLMPKCEIIEGKSGDFILGLLLVGVLSMLDIGIVYHVLIDFLV